MAPFRILEPVSPRPRKVRLRPEGQVIEQDVGTERDVVATPKTNETLRITSVQLARELCNDRTEILLPACWQA